MRWTKMNGDEVIKLSKQAKSRSVFLCPSVACVFFLALGGGWKWLEQVGRWGCILPLPIVRQLLRLFSPSHRDKASDR
jgi:hypothetical protein